MAFASSYSLGHTSGIDAGLDFNHLVRLIIEEADLPGGFSRQRPFIYQPDKISKDLQQELIITARVVASWRQAWIPTEDELEKIRAVLVAANASDDALESIGRRQRELFGN